MTVKNTIETLVDILKVRMNLSDEQIWVYNQSKKISNTQGIYIVIQEGVKVPFAVNKSTQEAENGDLQEVTTQKYMEDYIINIVSRNNEALMRQVDILAAISSVYSQQQQEKTGIQIYRVPTSFVPLPENEGGSMLYRYAITIKILTNYISINNVEYYNQFPDIETNNN